jgi:hypothetical protein
MESKFTGVLAKLKQPPAESPASPIETPVIRGKGRPPGKRSDPDYQPTTVLLRKQTKKAAARLLEDQETGQDLSELIEELLTEWIHNSVRSKI